MNRLHRSIEGVVRWIDLARGRLRARVLAALRGASLGKKVAFGPYVRVLRPWGLHVGDRAVVEEGVCIKLVSDDAKLVLGDFTFIGRGTQFDIAQLVTIGSHTLIAPGCFITDHNHDIAAGLLIDQQPCITRPVVIGDDVWIGAKVVVLPGVRIGDGAVVAAGAVVTRDIAPMTLVAGVPARVVRPRT